MKPLTFTCASGDNATLKVTTNDLNENIVADLMISYDGGEEYSVWLSAPNALRFAEYLLRAIRKAA